MPEPATTGRPGSSAKRPSIRSSVSKSSRDEDKESKSSRSPEQKKRHQVVVACNECRKRKVKCDGGRPICAPCVARASNCHFEADPDATPIIALKRKYEVLQKRHSDLIELYDMLKTRPAHEAWNILKRVRSDEDATSVLALIKHGDLLIQPRNPGRHSHYSPSSHLQAALGINVEHPNVYPPLTPLESPADPFMNQLVFIKQRGDPKLPSRQSTSSTDDSMASSEANDILGMSLSQGQNPDGILKPAGGQGQLQVVQYDNPGAAVEETLCDPRLEYIRARDWTGVLVQDDVFRKLLSLYLSRDHPLTRYFDEDRFLDDLAAGRKTYCSRLLVDAVCSLACFNSSSIDANMAHLGHFFDDEAKRLFQKEADASPLTSIPAALILQYSSSLFGKDKMGINLLGEAIRLAKDMDLFKHQAAERVYGQQEPEVRRARAIVAWGAFYHTACISFHMHHEPGFRTPPPVPVPYEPEREKARRWLPHPRRGPLQPMEAGLLFQYVCELWLIGNDLCVLHFSQDTPPPEQHVNETSNLHRRLLAWADSLPAPLLRSEDSPSQVLLMHMFYHVMMVELFRPFVKATLGASSSLLVPPDNYADHITTASILQLQRLIYHYRVQYAGPPVNVFMEASLLCVAFATLPHLQDPESSFSFCLSVTMLAEMAQSFPVIQYVLKHIRAAVVARDILLPPEAQAAFVELDRNRPRNRTSLEGRRSPPAPVNLEVSVTDLEATKMENLVRGTGRINMNDP